MIGFILRYWNERNKTGVPGSVGFIFFCPMDTKRFKVSEAEMQEFHHKLGERIKQLRKQRGYSNHEQFAFERGIARAQYGKYERGIGMNFSTIVKIAAAMEISLAEFFSEGFD